MMSPMHPFCEIVRDGDEISLCFERNFSQPPERVWRALTESDQLRGWMPCDLVGDREAGAELVVPFWDDVAEKYEIEESVLTGRIVTWDPHTTFSWEWDDELLTSELRATATGTHLTHTVRLGSMSPGAVLTAAGYHTCLDHLVALVETDDPPRFIDADPKPLEAMYAALDEQAS